MGGRGGRDARRRPSRSAAKPPLSPAGRGGAEPHVAGGARGGSVAGRGVAERNARLLGGAQNRSVFAETDAKRPARRYSAESKWDAGRLRDDQNKSALSIESPPGGG